MRARSAAAAAGAALPWLLAFLGLLSWARCGSDPSQGAAPGTLEAPLEAPEEVMGPAPQLGGAAMDQPLQVVGSDSGWLVTWSAAPWVRGVRLGPEGLPVDPPGGLLLDPEFSQFQMWDGCAPASLSGGWVVPCRTSIALVGASGAPRLVPAPWAAGVAPEAAVGGRGLVLVHADGWYAIDAEGQVAWQVDLPRLDGAQRPFVVATEAGFLVGGTVLPEPMGGLQALVQPIAPDGQVGEPVVLAAEPLHGLASGPAGALAWFGTGTARVVPLDAASGAPAGAEVEVPDALSLVATNDGWLLERGAEGWRIDGDLDLTPVDLPADASWFRYAYAAGPGALLQAALVDSFDAVWAGPVRDEGTEHVLVGQGLERQEALAVGGGDGVRLVVERTLRAEGLVLRAWRVDADGVLLDETPTRLVSAPGNELSTSRVVVAGDGAPWLVAVGRVGEVQLFEIGSEGPPVARGRLACDLSGADAEGRFFQKLAVTPAALRLSDGWVIGCLDRALAPAGRDPALFVRPAVHRLDSSFVPRFDGPRVLTDDWVGGSTSPYATNLVVAEAEGRWVLAWPEGPADVPPSMRLMQVAPDTAEVVGERTLSNAASPIGIAARGAQISVLGLDPTGPALAGAVLEGFGDPDPALLSLVPGLRAFVAEGPVFVGGALWTCWTLVYPAEGMHPVECVRLDQSGGAEPLDRVTFGEQAKLGGISGSEEALSVAYSTWRDGTVRSALALLAAGAEAGDGGSDAGDGGLVPDAGDGGGDGGLVPDGGDGGDGGDDGGLVPDAGDAGDDGGLLPDAGDGGDDGGPAPDAGDAGVADGGTGTDAGAPDAGGSAGTPGDEGGCDGCAASGGGDVLALCALLALLWLPAHRRP